MRQRLSTVCERALAHRRHRVIRLGLKNARSSRPCTTSRRRTVPSPRPRPASLEQSADDARNRITAVRSRRRVRRARASRELVDDPRLRGKPGAGCARSRRGRGHAGGPRARGTDRARPGAVEIDAKVRGVEQVQLADVLRSGSVTVLAKRDELHAVSDRRVRRPLQDGLAAAVGLDHDVTSSIPPSSGASRSSFQARAPGIPSAGTSCCHSVCASDSPSTRKMSSASRASPSRS